MTNRLSSNLINAIFYARAKEERDGHIGHGWSAHDHKMILTLWKMGVLETTEYHGTFGFWRFSEMGLILLGQLVMMREATRFANQHWKHQKGSAM